MLNYTIRTELSQDGEYTYSFLKGDGIFQEIKIGNLESSIINKLQEYLSKVYGRMVDLEEDVVEIAKEKVLLKDKLSRRNMQIKELKEYKKSVSSTIGGREYELEKLCIETLEAIRLMKESDLNKHCNGVDILYQIVLPKLQNIINL